MGGTWLIARADLRRRWRAMLAMVQLIGLVSRVVLVVAAGARRTSPGPSLSATRILSIRR